MLLKRLNTHRKPFVPADKEFRVVPDILCEEARQMYDKREQYGPLGLLQIKNHLIEEKSAHSRDCPALDLAAISVIDELMGAC